MLKNYLQIAWRNLVRQRTHSILNIAGLSVALAACLIIFLVLRHEFSFDRYHSKAEEVYQIVKKDKFPDGEVLDTGTPFPTARALRNDYPGIKFAELFTSVGSQVTVLAGASHTGTQKYLEEGPGLFFAEPELFDMLDLDWLKGNAAVLSQPGKAAISKATATKYFGSWQQAMGGVLLIDNNILVEIAAVFNDVPPNSDFPFKLVPSYETFRSNTAVFPWLGDPENWGGSTSSHQVYLLLPRNTTEDRFNRDLAAFSKKYCPPTDRNTSTVFFLQPLKNVHFDTRFSNNGDHVSSKAALHTLAFIGALILLMACINFVNLSTALAVRRSKEVGIRKVIGSTGWQLKVLVFLETGLLVLLAAAVGFCIAWLSIPYLKYITEIQERLPLVGSASFLFLGIAVIVTTLLSGIYPALVMSRFKPVEAIKNKINSSAVGGISLRRLLIVLQFSFSQLLVAATIITVSQMNFIQNADLGLRKEGVLMLSGSSDSAALARLPAFKYDLQQIAGIHAVSFAMDAPSSGNTWTSNFSFDRREKSQDFDVNIKMGDEEYARVFGLDLLAGRFIDKADSLPEFVINETLCSKLGMQSPADAVGKEIKVGGGKWTTITGVVRDFKNNSLREAVPPTVIMNRPQFETNTHILVNADQMKTVMGKIEALWEKHFPAYAFKADWLDESIANFYRQEERMSRLYKVYAALAIFISCLGLYGLVSFMAVQKTKEVGIRKVLGATTAGIVYLFSREFTLLVLAAFLIAAPVAWWMMNNWLNNFVFRIRIGADVFFLSLLLSLVIAWLTVGYKAMKAALANPVKSLRSD